MDGTDVSACRQYQRRAARGPASPHVRELLVEISEDRGPIGRRQEPQQEAPGEDGRRHGFLGARRSWMPAHMRVWRSRASWSAATPDGVTVKKRRIRPPRSAPPASSRARR